MERPSSRERLLVTYQEDRTVGTRQRQEECLSDHDLPVLVLTNDDGIDAPGMLALRQATLGLGRCRVIAPVAPSSGCGHQVTTHGPILITPWGNDALAVSGTPVDCVRLAKAALAPDLRWVLSGINAGGNLGTEVYHSGTVAAVREAAIRGVTGIAVSHYIARGREIDWARAAAWTARVLRALLARPCEPGTFWNVNLPHPPPGCPEPAIVFAPLDPSPLPSDYRFEGDVAIYCGDYQNRARQPGTDVSICFGRQISVTLMRLTDSAGTLGRDADPGRRAGDVSLPNL
jgi:5'-nucleotidase